MQFLHKGQSIVLKGVPPAELSLTDLPVDKMLKWLVGNDVWALAVVDLAPAELVPVSLPEEVKGLLTEFKDVFAEP